MKTVRVRKDVRPVFLPGGNYYSAEMAAQKLGVSGRTVRNVCISGAMGTRIGRAWMLREDEVARFIVNPVGRPKKPKDDEHGKHVAGPALPGGTDGVVSGTDHVGLETPDAGETATVGECLAMDHR